MDEILTNAALTGSIDALYASIQNNPYVLELIDQIPFVVTPLHLAAAAGHVEFAMEVMILKPSFARKLNQEGLSPVHLAVDHGHQELAVLFMEHDKNLVRVKGKHGKTPMHLAISREENLDLLAKFLEACPECIRDVTTKNQTALHIATEDSRLKALQLLCGMLRKSEYCEDVVNQKDRISGETALHIAAHKNQPEMLKMLLKCKADKYATDQAGRTVLDVAEQQESFNTLSCWPFGRISSFRQMIRKHMVKYVTKASEIIFKDMDNISTDDRNALLVVLGLLITATFQAGISPPGGVWQGDASSNPTSTGGNNGHVPGTSVMNEYQFLYFYMPAYTVFIVTLFLTLGLLKPFPHGFRTALQVLLAFLAISFDQSILVIAPNEVASIFIAIFSGVVFVFMMFMCVAYRVSKLSVLILGFWFAPDLFSRFKIETYLFIGCWLLLGLYDTFWIGSTLLLGGIMVINKLLEFHLLEVTIPMIVLVGALFLHYIGVIE